MTGRHIAMVLSNAFVSDPRVEKEASALLEAGFSVTVLAWDRERSAPEEERRAGVRVIRLGPAARHGGGLSNVPGYRRFWRSASAVLCDMRPWAVHCHDLDTAPVGSAVSRGTGCRLVLDFHELYRESNMMPDREPMATAARAAARSVERRAIPAADLVLVANPGTVPYYERLARPERIVPIENAPDAEFLKPAPGVLDDPGGGGAGLSVDRPFTVGYFGQKRYPEGLLALIDAVAQTEGAAAILAGGGTSADEVARAAAGIGSIEVSGRFLYAELPGLYARCDAVYAVYEARTGNVRTLFPVKVMEAMACGLPSIAAKGTWAGEYVEREGIGMSVPPGDVPALREVLVRLREDGGLRARMGARGRAIVEGGLNWASVSRRLVAAYEGLLS